MSPRLSVDQYDERIRTGAISVAKSVALIDGRIVNKPVRNRPRIQAGKLGLAALQRIVPADWHVAKEDPFVASRWSKPEPDLAIVRGRISDYADRDVTASDLGLVVEVADSSLAEDRDVMARLYASGGIPAYWIINLVDRWVEVYTDPDPTAGYRTKTIIRPGEEIPVVLDGTAVGQISVGDLF